jgi:hypothetical protein
MASDQQVLQLIQLGFEQNYAESLHNKPARQLISQCYGICRTYYAGNRIDLRTDVEQAVERNQNQYGRKLAPAMVSYWIEKLAEFERAADGKIVKVGEAK